MTKSVESARWLTQWACAFSECARVPSLAFHTLTVLSCDPVYMNPVPPHLTHDTEPLWPLSTISIFCWFVDHIRTVASFDADASLGSPGFCTWYGSHARLVTHLVWPFIGFPNCFPVLGSHILTVLSMLPVAIRDSSGDQLTAKTQLVCPFNVWTGVPVSQSHIRAVLSPLPLTILDEDRGENCTARIASPCPGIVDAHRDTACTRNTACGAAEMFCTSSVLMRPGVMRVL
jgi:hypothetical protein